MSISNMNHVSTTRHIKQHKTFAKQLQQERILKALLFIHENLDDTLELNRVAGMSHYSPYHFHRLFRKVTTRPVHEYIKQLKLQRALIRLAYSHMPVTHIAHKAGFQAAEAFSRMFKQLYNFSPTQYRTLYRNQPILNELQGFSCVRDSNQTYIDATKIVCQKLGFKDILAFHGKQLHEVKCSVADIAPVFAAQDKLVIETHQPLTSIDFLNYNDSYNILLSTTSPVFSEDGAVNNVFVQSIDFKDHSFFDFFLKLKEVDEKRFGHTGSQSYFFENESNSLLDLHPQESSCLFYLIRNSKIKEIAAIHSCTEKQIEFTLSSMMNKMQCQSTQQLIEKALVHHFQFIIPQRILQAKSLYTRTSKLTQNQSLHSLLPGVCLTEI